MELKDLISQKTNFFKYDIYLQYLGFEDAKKEEVYEGDVLRLEITNELMDESQNQFYNSNLGIHIAELRTKQNITGFVLHLDSVDTSLRSMHYTGYIEVDGYIENNKNALKALCFSEDSLFPRYLCAKGAYKIGNTLLNKDLLWGKMEPT